MPATLRAITAVVRPLSTCTWTLVLATSCLAADGSLSPGDLDTRIDQVIFRTISIGAPLYNQGDAAGCYRLYQGALIAIEPMLGHRAALRQEVAKGLKDVESVARYAQRATELRRILDRVVTVVRTSPSPSESPSSPPPQPQPRPQHLWARLGGEPAVRAIVHDFVALAASDPQVDFPRGGRYSLDAAAVANLENRLVELISAGSGGPLRYEGRPMRPVHQGMAITDAQFDTLAGDLGVVLNKYSVPRKEADELLAIVASTRKDIVLGPSAAVGAPPPTPPPTSSAAVSLWARLGGEPAVKAVVHDFVARAAGDPQVDFTRGGRYSLDAAAVANLEKLLVELISAVSGGPLKYEGRPMKPLHQGMAITDAQFNALAADLSLALKEYNVTRKEADELLAIIAATRKDVVEAGPRR